SPRPAATTTSATLFDPTSLGPAMNPCGCPAPGRWRQSGGGRALEAGAALTWLKGEPINRADLEKWKRAVPLKLILANKAYSSWSLRPWILLTHFRIPFEEVVIPMDQPETRANMLKFSPTGKCPSLQDGKITVWESLAIIDYVAETHPEKPIWP